jgi:hypothetical protein
VGGERVTRWRATPPAQAWCKAGAAALGFVVGDRTIEDVDEEIDVEGDDLSAFGAAQFTETEVLAEDGASGSPET